MYFSAKVWRILFFVGVIQLNIMVPFRAGALKAGGWKQFAWSGGVVVIGAFLLYCLWQLRLHRQAKQSAATSSTTQEAHEEHTGSPQPEVTQGQTTTPTAFVPPSRHKAVAHSKKAQKKKKKRKKR